MAATETEKLLSKTAFWTVVVLFAAVAGVYLYNIVKWAEGPDFGFNFHMAAGITTVGGVAEPGRKAGMGPGDRILTVNGKTFSTFGEFRSAMHRALGEENTYLLERDGQEFTVTIKNNPLGLNKSFEISGLAVLVGLCYVLIGTLVFLMKPYQLTSWMFFLFTISLGLIVTFFRRAKLEPLWLDTVLIVAYSFTPAVIIHLAFCFPEKRMLLRRHPYTQIIPYLASSVVFVCIRSRALTMEDAPKLWIIVAVVYMVAGVLFFLGSCLQLVFTSISHIVKVRSKMILVGFAIAASLPLAEFVANAFFYKSVVPGDNYLLPFFVAFPLSIGYSIVKHDLFDIDAIIKRTYGYVLTTGAIAGIYGVFVLVSNLAFGRFEVTKSPMFPLVFILAVVFFFNPVRNRVQRFIDRVFYRLEYDYQGTVQRISETMRSLLKLDEIGKTIMDTALGAMFIDSGCVMLLNKEKNAYECLVRAGERAEGRGKAGPEGTLAADDAIIRKIEEKKKGVTIYDIQEDPFFDGVRESGKKAFDQMSATLIVPLVYEDRLTGLMSLGQKKSGKFYRSEDINLLNTLANQGAVAIENAMLLEEVIEKERMEEELAIARDLQTSMLPATCPQIEGFELAAMSIPAREVGGDFFDFIKMGKDRLGLVIGDVTGKSVSGALVMAASRSVFRMLSEEELTVGEIMIRANRRTKKDIKKGMFVALLYAVLNASERTLGLCSAGQTQPIHLSEETGKAGLVETEGDTFPLGILEDAAYEETRLRLAPGDKVVFYTDGIVEAMNEQGEIFGFERLLEVVQASQSATADSLLKEIIDRVSTFAGGTSQHDDLTLIVLSVAD